VSEKVVRTYLEMTSQPDDPLGLGPAGASLKAVNPCPVPLYRLLYGEVGGPWQWYERRHWSAEVLAGHLGRNEVEVTVLTVEGQPAGYYELVRHPDRSVEIGYFGLMPGHLGKGLGGWMLRSAIRDAWASSPTRVWVHTCTLDHPAALPNYLRRGFRITRTEEVEGLPLRP
jgi:GNAT superfamily N-acetyltransferase